MKAAGTRRGRKMLDGARSLRALGRGRIATLTRREFAADATAGVRLWRLRLAAKFQIPNMYVEQNPPNRPPLESL